MKIIYLWLNTNHMLVFHLYQAHIHDKLSLEISLEKCIQQPFVVQQYHQKLWHIFLYKENVLCFTPTYSEMLGELANMTLYLSITLLIEQWTSKIVAEFESFILKLQTSVILTTIFGSRDPIEFVFFEMIIIFQPTFLSFSCIVWPKLTFFCLLAFHLTICCIMCNGLLHIISIKI